MGDSVPLQHNWVVMQRLLEGWTNEEDLMQLAIHIVSFDTAGGTSSTAQELGEAAHVADEIGVSTLSVMDHYFQMEHMAPAEQPMLEGYTTLGFFAGHTSKVKLHLLVTGVTYRQPGLLAKIVSTLDVLSKGRGELGIGAAWYEREHVGLGVGFPAVSERFERLEEAIQICLQMWDPQNDGPFEGRHYQLRETLCSPQPLTRPHPAILIGGGGERKTLRLVAKYSDACNLFASDPSQVSHKLAVLRKHCDEVGRDYETIRRTMLFAPRILDARDADQLAVELEPYADLGIDEVVLVPPGDRPARWLEHVGAPAIPRLAQLGA